MQCAAQAQSAYPNALELLVHSVACRGVQSGVSPEYRVSSSGLRYDADEQLTKCSGTPTPLLLREGDPGQSK